MPPTVTTEPPAPTTPRRHRRLDLAIGILLGLVLGLAVISAFVFLGSEGSIDAPRITGVDTGKPSRSTTPDSGAGTAAQRPAQP
jgi:hypothetical protein